MMRREGGRDTQMEENGTQIKKKKQRAAWVERVGRECRLKETQERDRRI